MGTTGHTPKISTHPKSSCRMTLNGIYSTKKDTVDTADTADTVDMADMADMADMVDTVDTVDMADTVDTAVELLLGELLEDTAGTVGMVVTVKMVDTAWSKELPTVFNKSNY